MQEQLAVGARFAVEGGDDLLDRVRLLGEEPRRLGRGERDPRQLDPRPAAPAHPGPRRQHQSQPARGGRAVLAGDPEAEPDQLRRRAGLERFDRLGKPLSGQSKHSARSTTTPRMRRLPKGTLTTLPTSRSAISAGSR